MKFKINMLIINLMKEMKFKLIKIVMIFIS